MPRILPPLILALAVTGIAQAQKKVYCWDEGGRRVCGDALPAEASGKARTEISSKSGLTTGRVARALTEDERSAAAQAAQAARKQAEIDAAAARRDLAMVESYMTEDDLRRAYRDRTSLLDETLKTAALGVDTLRQSLLGLLRQAGDLELQGRPVPKPVAANILHQHAELRRQQQLILAQRAERKQLEIEQADALVRYRALKGEPGAQAQPASTAPVPATPAAPAPAAG